MIEYKSKFTPPVYSECHEGELFSAHIVATEIVNKVINDRIQKLGDPEATDHQPSSIAYLEKDIYDMEFQDIRNYIMYFYECVSDNYYLNYNDESRFKAFIPADDIKKIKEELNKFFNDILEFYYPGIVKIFDYYYLKGERWLGDIRYQLLAANGTEGEHEAKSALMQSIILWDKCEHEWHISVDILFEIMSLTSHTPYWDVIATSEGVCESGFTKFKSVSEMYTEEVRIKNSIIDLTFHGKLDEAYNVMTEAMADREEAYRKIREDRDSKKEKKNDGK